jgi:hypothetical protein
VKAWFKGNIIGVGFQGVKPPNRPQLNDTSLLRIFKNVNMCNYFSYLYISFSSYICNVYFSSFSHLGLFCIVSYCIVLHGILWYFVVLNCINCTVLYSIAWYFVVLYCVQYLKIFFLFTLSFVSLTILINRIYTASHHIFTLTT